MFFLSFFNSTCLYKISFLKFPVVVSYLPEVVKSLFHLLLILTLTLYLLMFFLHFSKRVFLSFSATQLLCMAGDFYYADYIFFNPMNYDQTDSSTNSHNDFPTFFFLFSFYTSSHLFYFFK